MTFSRVNVSGWAVGDQLTSAQMNALDIDHANALDKTTAGDTLSGVVTMASTAVLNAGHSGNIVVTTAGALQGTVPNGIQALVSGAVIASASGGVQASIAGGIHDGGTAGGIEATVAGGIRTTVVGGLALNGGAGDFPTFNPTRSKAYRFGMRPIDPSAVVPVGTGGAKWTYGSFLGILTGNATTTNLALWIENAHQGATLFAVILYYAVGQSHANVPATMPSMTVFRQPAVLGSAPVAASPLNTAGSIAIPTPGSGSAWFSSGNVQTFSYPCNQNNVIDNTQFTYFISLQDENGTNSLAGNLYIHFAASYISIPDMTFPV